MQKGFLFVFVFLLLGAFVWKKTKILFACSFRVYFFVCFPFLCPQRPVFNFYLFFLLCFLVSFCPPFQNSIFSCFLSIDPFWKYAFLFLQFVFICCLCYCSCLFVSFKQTFLTSPLWNPNCFHLFFCCFCFCFHVLCFRFSVFMLVLFLVCFYFVCFSSFASCFAFRLLKALFPLQF